MKKLLIPIMFLLFSTIGLADSTATTCLNNQTAQHNVSIYNTSDMVAMLTITENETCPWNCSATLNDCRWDELTQMSSFLGIMVIAFLICMFGLYIGRRMVMMDFPIYAVMMVFFALMGGVFDVFIARYQTMLLALFFVPVGFFLLSLYLNMRTRREIRGENRGTGR